MNKLKCKEVLFKATKVVYGRPTNIQKMSSIYFVRPRKQSRLVILRLKATEESTIIISLNILMVRDLFSAKRKAYYSRI